MQGSRNTRRRVLTTRAARSAATRVNPRRQVIPDDAATHYRRQQRRDRDVQNIRTGRYGVRAPVLPHRPRRRTRARTSGRRGRSDAVGPARRNGTEKNRQRWTANRGRGDTVGPARRNGTEKNRQRWTAAVHRVRPAPVGRIDAAAMRAVRALRTGYATNGRRNASRAAAPDRPNQPASAGFHPRERGTR